MNVRRIVVSIAAVGLGILAACGDSLTGGAPETLIQGTPDAAIPVDTGTPSIPDATTVVDAAETPNDADVTDSDAGSPFISPTVVDFGSVNCGTTATAKTFTIKNPTQDTVEWAASLSKGTNSSFTIAPTSGSLAPGGSVVVTATPAKIPATASTAANGFGDLVFVSIGTSTTSVQLLQSARGAVLAFVPTSLAFGSVPIGIGGGSSSTIGVFNSGNADANVTLSLTGSSSYSLPSGNSQTLTTMPGVTTTSLVTFTPPAALSYSAEIALATASADVLCAPLPSPLALSGKGTVAVPSVTPPSILFGDKGYTDCGTAAATQIVTIKNTGNASLGWSAALLHGANYFMLSANSGTIAGNGSQQITVTPKTIPTSSVITPDGYSDTLTISTNAPGDTPHDVQLHQTARGAIVARSTSGLSFSNVPVGTTSTQQYTFSNTGNVDITLGFTNGDTGFIQPASVIVGATGFANPAVVFAPTTARSYSDIGIVSNTKGVPLCGSLPGTLSLSGTGTTATVSATPSSLNFGSVRCGAAGTPLTVKLTNNGPATTFSTSLLKDVGSFFSVSPTTGSIAALGSITLTVTPLTLPQYGPTSSNYYGDTLRVSTTNGVVDIALSQTALGAVLTFNKTSNAFGNVNVGSSGPGTVSVSNTGTLAANIVLAASPSVFTVTPTTASITGSTTLPFDLAFKPSSAISYTGALGISVVNTTLCSPLPADVVLTGTGK